jgi:hypothetical protein
MGREYDFSRRMEAAQRQAKIARNTGRHVGASAKGWDLKRPELDRNSFADAFRVAFEAWRVARDDARNDFAAACLNGRNWEEELRAIPF